jgi:hypothetical protein
VPRVARSMSRTCVLLARLANGRRSGASAPESTSRTRCAWPRSPAGDTVSY